MRRFLPLLFILLMPSLAIGSTLQVGGGQTYATITACIAAMANGDICNVHAGTYNETPTLSAGAVNNYKTIQANGSDVVSVLGFVEASHTKIIGNCAVGASAGSCGFTITNTATPTSGCISVPNGTTDIFIKGNVLNQCGHSNTAMIDSNYPNSSTFVYIQGNTLSYACVNSGVQVSTTGTFSSGANSMTVAMVGGAQNGWVVYGTGINVSSGVQISHIDLGPPIALTLAPQSGGNATTAAETNTPITLTPATCNAISAYGDHWLVENNDISHYTLGIDFVTATSIFRNNTFHDQNQSEAHANTHTDTMFSEPGLSVPVTDNVIEGNTQTNAVGPDAKGVLSQGELCGGTCSVLIERFNTVSRVGGGVTTNNTTWDAMKSYNNTFVDAMYDTNLGCGPAPATENSTPDTGSHHTTKTAEYNNIYYYTNSGASTGCWSPYNVATSAGNSAVWGYSLAYCTPSCGTLYGHLYQSGSFASETGQSIADPKFISYVSAGSSSNNYGLQVGSPALGAGTKLTTVANTDTGSGTSLIVNDATFFQDGYGLTNPNSTVQGDCVAVTTVTNNVCVLAVNYSTNTLTLAGSITRSAGDSVWLYSDSSGSRRLFNSQNLGSQNATAATPTFSPTGGTYSSTQTVTISTTSSGAIICYTTNGTTPATNGTTGCTTGTLYSGTISVASSETVKAIAGGSGYVDSAVGLATYTINSGGTVSGISGGVISGGHRP